MRNAAHHLRVTRRTRRPASWRAQCRSAGNTRSLPLRGAEQEGPRPGGAGRDPGGGRPAESGRDPGGEGPCIYETPGMLPALLTLASRAGDQVCAARAGRGRCAAGAAGGSPQCADGRRGGRPSSAATRALMDVRRIIASSRLPAVVTAVVEDASEDGLSSGYETSTFVRLEATERWSACRWGGWSAWRWEGRPACRWGGWSAWRWEGRPVCRWGGRRGWLRGGPPPRSTPSR
jgi:hypothetical protein